MLLLLGCLIFPSVLGVSSWLVSQKFLFWMYKMAMKLLLWKLCVWWPGRYPIGGKQGYIRTVFAVLLAQYHCSLKCGVWKCSNFPPLSNEPSTRSVWWVWSKLWHFAHFSRNGCLSTKFSRSLSCWHTFLSTLCVVCQCDPTVFSYMIEYLDEPRAHVLSGQWPESPTAFLWVIQTHLDSFPALVWH